MLRRLRHHAALNVEPLAACATRDLLKIPDAQNGEFVAVVFKELGKENGTNRDINTDPKSVGAADDLEQPLLRQFFNQQPVFWQKPGVVQPNAMTQVPLHVFAIGAIEANLPKSFCERALVVFARVVGTHEILRGFGASSLRKVHDVNGRLAVGNKVGEGFVEGRFLVLVIQGNRSLGGMHDGRRASGSLFKIAGEKVYRPQGGGHQKKAYARQREQGHLPSDASFLVGVVVKLVHDDRVGVQVGAFAERHVGENFGGAANDGRIAVHARVAGNHADILGPKRAAEIEELLAHEGFDGARVKRPVTFREGLKMERLRDEGFP